MHPLCNATQPLHCTRCQNAPRLPGQRWCRSCLTQSQRERRAAKRAAQAAVASAGVTQASEQEMPRVTQGDPQAPATAAPNFKQLMTQLENLLREFQQQHG